MGAPAAEQLSFPDLNEAAEISLHETTFVVVDYDVIHAVGCLSPEYMALRIGGKCLSVEALAVAA